MGSSLTRVSFRATDSSGQYNCPINPRVVNLEDSSDQEFSSVIDGAGITLASNFDNRVRRLQWDNFDNDNSIYTTMIGVLKGYLRQEKEINLQDLDILGLGWKRIRVLNVGTTSLDGGEIRYRFFLDFVFTEAI